MHPLLPFAAPPPAIRSLTVNLTRPAPGRLALEYHLDADIARLRIPPPAAPERTDGLWRHTCFEAFIGTGDEYREFNFSPSHAWAAYRFTGYRAGMAPLELSDTPAIVSRSSADRLVLGVTLDLEWLPRPAAGAGLRLGLTAVVEDGEGVLSYWALRHPADKPDFHHPESRVLALDSPP